MTNPLIDARDAFVSTHPEQRRTVNGRDWGTIRVGSDGPLLILIPGTLGRADIFWQQLEALASEARILALTYPETGGVADWSEDIRVMVEEDGLHGATILGSSLGGYLVQFATATRPSIFGGLIAANTLADASLVRMMPPYSLDLVNVEIEDLRAGFLTGLQTWVTPDNPYSDLAELLIAEVRGRIPEAELRNRLIALKEAPVLPAPALPAERTFTVESDDDHLIAPPIRAAVRARLNPHRAFRFQAASHFPYVTQPDAYTALIRDALGLPTGRSPWPAGADTSV